MDRSPRRRWRDVEGGAVVILADAIWLERIIVGVCVAFLLVFVWLGMNGPGPGHRGWFVGD